MEEILARAGEADEAEGHAQPTLGGELPAPLARRGSRLARLQAALAEIEAERAQAEAEAARREARWAEDAAGGRRPRGRSPADAAQALVRARADVAALEARLQSATDVLVRACADSELDRARRRLAEAETAAAAAPPPPEAQANTTDPSSRMMKTAGGWVQGYNAQAAVNEHQVVLAATVSADHNDVGQLLPTTEAVAANAAAAGVKEGIGVVVADAGYWSEDNATAPGPERLIATTKDWKQRKAAREMGTTTGPPPPDASPLVAMEHRLRTTEGAATYAKRSGIVEPVFGQAKENRGFRRFMRRGIDAAQSEWSLICFTANIAKLHVHADGRSLAALLSAT